MNIVPGPGRIELGRTLWRFRREMAWVAVFSLFANVMMLTPALYMLQVFDRVMISGSGLTLIALTAIATLFLLIMGFAEWVRSRLLVRTGVRLDEQLNRALFEASFEASLKGETAKPLQAFMDLTRLRQFLTGQGAFAVFDTPWTLVYIGVLALMHPYLGLAAALFTAVSMLLAVWSGGVTMHRHAAAADKWVEANAFLGAKLRNAEAVEAMGMVGHLQRHWSAMHDAQSDAQVRAVALQARTQAVAKYVQYSQQALTLALGAWLVIRGEIGVGAMVAANMLVNLALRPIGTLVATWRQFVEARGAYGRIERLVALCPVRPSATQPIEVVGQVSLRGLRALAEGRSRPILDGLDADFAAGEVVAIVGPSGAGKSTLARCLVGVWPQTEGEVLLDGHPITALPRDQLGPQVGYLPQDLELLDGTIAENIARFGDVDASQVIDAARRTGIHEMILRLSSGYDTPMGEAGRLMSGGQRQRIALARAIYGNPRLVVLDEPGANLDDAGEAALLRTLRELKQRGSTVFMVLHQRQLLAAADRVLVLQEGAIAQLARVAVRPAVSATSRSTVPPSAASEASA